MNVISGFLSMLFDVSSRRKQGRDADMPTLKECEELLELHNKTREVYELAPLVLHDNCGLVAQSHAVWMANSQSVSHLGFSFFGPAQRLAIVGEEPSSIGECISLSSTNDASMLMKAWFRSESHKKILLGDYSHVGIGRHASSDGYSYWCAIYIDNKKSKRSPKLSMSDSIIDF
jgi:uncharacterized protein YkwD